MSEHKNGPHDSSKYIEHNGDDQEYKDKPVQIKRQAILEFLEDVGGNDYRDNGKWNGVCYNTQDQREGVSVTGQGHKNHAAHESLHNFHESR